MSRAALPPSFNGGRTIGKLVGGTRVVREDGQRYGLGTAFLRDVVCRFTGILPFFILVDSLMPLGSKRQTLRDRMVGTLVLKEASYRARRWPLTIAAVCAAAAVGWTLYAAGVFDDASSDPRVVRSAHA